MSPDSYLDICIATQQLSLLKNGQVIKTYPISTAKNGAGEIMGSGCTPRGWHCIRAKIGKEQPLYAVFKARRTTGEIYSPALAAQYPQRDWILSRILWLGGLEPHKNRYGQVDTSWRYIYLHGCPDELMDGTPQSHGCIRMYNTDIIALFNQVSVGMRVYIHE